MASVMPSVVGRRLPRMSLMVVGFRVSSRASWKRMRVIIAPPRSRCLRRG